MKTSASFFSFLIRFGLALFLLLAQVAFWQPAQEAAAAPSTEVTEPLSENPSPFYVPVPSVALSVPAQVFIGEEFSFTATFDNTDAVDTGYGPFIDVVFPETGADGAGAETDDGITFQGASYLGSAIPSAQIYQETFPDVDLGFGVGCVQHPIAVQPGGQPGNPELPLPHVVCGTPGDSLVTIVLPFGSFVPAQPPAVVTINASLSNLADLDTPLAIRAQGGFQFGATPLNDFCCGIQDATIPTAPASYLTPSWTPASVTPALMTLSKRYIGPENETSTGPNYPRQFEITVNVAEGQTIAPLVINDVLPGNIQFVSLNSVVPADTAGLRVLPSTSTPGGTLSVSIPSVTGSAGANDARVVFTYYVDRAVSGAPIIPPDSGAPTTSSNSADSNGPWVPLDLRDQTPPPPNATAACTPPCVTVEDHSIVVQKSVTNISDASNSPGDTLEYTLAFQVSDFFGLQNISLTDVISDGQRFDATFTPRLVVAGNPSPARDFNGNFAPANYTIDNSDIGNDINPATAGTQTVIFNVSGQLGAQLLGACVEPGLANNPPNCSAYNDGGTSGTVTFRTVIQENFSDTYPSGDPSVDHGDLLDNEVTVTGEVLDVASTPVGGLYPGTGNYPSDDSSAGLSIAFGTLVKSIYAVNGNTSIPTTLSPGDVVTYRLQYSQPASDFETTTLVDYLPLPVFNATQVATFNNTQCGTPAAGVACLGPNDTYHSLNSAPVNEPNPVVVPVLTTSSGANSLTFTYASYDSATNTSSVIDLLFSATVRNDPFADGLFLTNQANASEGTTNAGNQTLNAINQIKLGEPNLRTAKTAVSTNHTPVGDLTFTPNQAIYGQFNQPGGAGAPFSGVISSNSLSSDPDNPAVAFDLFNGTLTGVDGGDLVKYAIIVENKGSSRNGAYDIVVNDLLPAGMSIPTGGPGLNLQIYRGDGTALTFEVVNFGGNGVLGGGDDTATPGTPANASLIFNPGYGIRVVDPSGVNVPGACQVASLAGGANVIVITYDLSVDNSNTPGETIINTGKLHGYAGSEGGPNFLPAPLNDDAEIVIGQPALAKTLTSTEINSVTNGNTQAVIGEFVTYTITTTLHEGILPAAQLVDTLDAGLAFVDLVSVTVSNPDTDGASSGDNGVYSSALAFDASGNCTNCVAGTNPTVTPVNVANLLTFNLGTVTNTNTDNATDETLTIVYRAVVLNVSGNQAGTLLNNSVLLAWDDGNPTTTDSLPVVNAPEVTVIEPVLTISKATVPAVITSLDAGDSLTYQITITNSGTTDAYDVTFRDPLPLYFGSPTITGVSGTGGAVVGDFEIVGCPAACVAQTTGTANLDLAPTETIIIELQGVIAASIPPNSTLSNTATVQWTSLDGNLVNRSTYNPDSDERTGTNPVVPPNDYTANNTVLTNVSNPLLLTKTLIATSEAHTSVATDVAIGEIVRYRLAVRIPEGTSRNLQLQDRLPLGLTFLNDGTARMAVVCNGAAPCATSSTIGGSAWIINGASGAVVPTYVLQPADISDNPLTDSDLYNSGSDVYFKLGDLLNSDNDADDEFVVIEFNALVDNSLGGSNDNGDTRNNDFIALENGVQSGADSADVTVTVREPVITNLDKQLTPPVPANFDAGDTVSFTITYSNTGATDAFEVALTDSLHSALDLTTVNAPSYSACSVTPVATDNSNTGAGNNVSLSFNRVVPGCQVSVVYIANVLYSVTPAQVITNTATVNYTSLPGAGTTGNLTGSNAPGGSGAANGERNGTGTNPPNDYTDNDNQNITIDNVVPLKSIIATTESSTSEVADPRPLAIGEVLTYRLAVQIPEGVSTNFSITDVLPAGFDYIANTIKLGYRSSNSVGNPITNANTVALPNASVDLAPANDGLPANASPTFNLPAAYYTYTSATRTLVVNLASPINNDSDADAEYVIVEFNVLVNNDANNNNTDLKNNNYTVSVNGNNTTSNTVVAQIVEPAVTIAKARVGAPVDAGDTYSYTLTITGAVTRAYDLVVTDTLPYTVNNAVIDLVSVVQTTVPGGVTVTDTSTYNASPNPDVVSATINQLDPGQQVVLTINVRILDRWPIGRRIDNTGTVTWTSLPGTDPNERNGSGTAPNDYTVTSTANQFTPLGAPAIDKITPADTTYTIGENVAYDIVVTLPEGTTRDLRIEDTLPAGLAYQSYALITAAAASGGRLTADFNGTVAVFVAPAVDSTGVIIFNLDNAGTTTGDTVTNGDNVATNNAFLLRVTARVQNIASNQNGTTLGNTARLLYRRGTSGADTPVTDTTVPGNITVLEPVLDITKDAASIAVTPDAGDDVNYTITITPNPASTATAYDIHFIDTLPVYADLQIGTVLVSGAGAATVTNLSNDGTNTIEVNISDIPSAAATVTITYTATMTTALSPSQLIQNTGAVDWSSLPGTVTGERNGSGGVNDYRASDTGDLYAAPVAPIKSIISTSETHTSEAGNGSDNGANARVLAIGEVMRYRLAIALPEGTSTNFVITDVLPTGLTFIDGTLRLAYWANSNVTNTNGAANTDLAGANANPDADPPTFSLPAAYYTYAAATRLLTIDLESPVNNDINDGNAEYVVLEFNVYVNNDANNNNTTIHDNYYSVTINGGTPVDSNHVYSRIDEPVLLLAKSASAATDWRYGDTVTYTLNLTSAAASAATAFDLSITDTVPAGLTFTGFGAPPAGWTASNIGPALTWTCNSPACSVPVGGSATFTYTVTVDAPPAATALTGDATVTNTAALTWTSLPGGQGTTTNPTGSSTPGTSGQTNGERNGSGTGSNDNRVSDDHTGGIAPYYSIGNRVWFDTDNDSQMDAAEVGVNGVLVQLYSASDLATVLASDVTANGGFYLFDYLLPGDYVVAVAADNFTNTGVGDTYTALVGYWSSATSVTAAGAITETLAPDADAVATDADDNGTRQNVAPLAGAVIAQAVTLGPTGLTEPTGEVVGQLEGGVGQGVQPDGRANMTVDFGFYRVEIGNLVYEDINANGYYDAGTDTPIVGANVRLYDSTGTNEIPVGADGILNTGDDAAGGVTTLAGGLYQFSGLPNGDYIIRVTGPLGMISTRDDFNAADNANPDVNADNNDNGLGTALSPVSAAQLSMAGGEAAANITVSNASGTTTDLTVDFGFVYPYALGNRVWFDTNNNAQIGAGEIGIDGVTVQLYRADAGGNPTGAVLATATTATDGTRSGYYLFDYLVPGDYVVVIPASNFGTGGALRGYWSSLTSMQSNGTITETAAPDPDLGPDGVVGGGDDDRDSDDNGTRQTSGAFSGAVISRAVTIGLSGLTEPTGETDLHGGTGDGAQPDGRANMTVDFGFYRTEIGNLLFVDVSQNGAYEPGETLLENARVRLYAADNTTEINVGPDGILGTADDAANGMLTNVSGNYLFSGLPAGDYIVKTVAPAGMVSTIDTFSQADNDNPDTNVDNNDNGDGRSGGTVTSETANRLTMTPGSTGALNNNTVTNATGTTSDPTVDFGFVEMVALGNRVWLDTGAGAGGVANDGRLNGTEAGVDNVTLQLFRSGQTPGIDTPVATTSTTGGGYYYFDNLAPDTYFVYIPAAEFQTGGDLFGYFSSTSNGTDQTIDQDFDENGIDANAPVNGIRSINYVLTPNTLPGSESQANYTGTLDDDNVNATADFGFVQFVAIGNRLWFDMGAGTAYNNGRFDLGESPVPDGVVVNLRSGLGALVASTTTLNGYYQFDNLLPGDYYIEIPASQFAGGPLDGYVSSVGSGTLETVNEDVDENGIDVTTLTTTGIQSITYTLQPDALVTGEAQTSYTGNLDDDNVNFTADFGFTRLVALGNRIWYDTGAGGGVANDGIQNGAEVGVNAVAVQLFRTGQTPGVDTPVRTTSTNPAGDYVFDNLVPGSYFVFIPASQFQTGNPLFGYSSSIGNGGDDLFDQDDDENGIDANVAVNGIRSNDYDLQPDDEPTADNQGGYTGGLDNNNVNYTADFGFVQFVAIGNVVWFDNGAGGGTANDGIRNGTEPGVDNVTVQLYGVGQTPGVDAPLAVTSTSGGGFYQFDNLAPGDYFIHIPASEFANTPGGDLFDYVSTQGNGTDETLDQNIDENGIDNPAPATNGISSPVYTLTVGAEPTGEGQGNYIGLLADWNVNFTADFGFVQLYALGNRVWFDTDNDAAIDAGEIGVNGVTVQLYRADASGNPTGAVLATTTTIAETAPETDAGYYLFDNLFPGNYVVVLPASNFGTGGALQGYWSSLTARQPDGSISETAAPDPDFGPDGVAGGGDDDRDSDDNGQLNLFGTLPGAVASRAVTLGPVGLTEPAAETDLRNGDDGVQPDGRANMTVDFGFYRVSVGNLVYSDGNRNGNYDGAPNDAPLAGLTVRLYAANGTTEINVGLDGILGTLDDAAGGMLTDVGGNYLFTGLPAGNYIVSTTAPSGTTSSRDDFSAADNANPNGNVDNNDNGLGVGSGAVASAAVTLTAGSPGALNNNLITPASGTTHNPTLDFGFTPKFSLGNRVWFDTDNSRTSNGTEVGINGVAVQLFASDGVTEIPVGPDGILGTGDDGPGGMLTVNGGYYLFNNLEAGDYMVVIPTSNFAGVLNGYWSSGTSRNDDGSLAEIATTDPDDNLDLDDNGMLTAGRVVSQVITLGPAANEPLNEGDLNGGAQGQPDAQANMTVDFGFYTLQQGDLVWDDTNNNGLYDSATETGLPNVDVQLWSANGNLLLGTDTTDASGLYTFTGLPQGNYLVRIPAAEFNPGGTLRDYFSSTGSATAPYPYEPAPAPDTVTVDADDNGTESGALGLGGYIQSSVFALTPAAEQASDNATGSTTEFRIDFGVYREVRVDLTVTKDDGIVYYLQGGTLTYTIVVTNNGPADAIGAVISDLIQPQIASWTWTCLSATGGASGCDGVTGSTTDFTDTVNLPQTSSLTYQVAVTISPTATATLNNTVTVAPPAGMLETNPNNNSATDSDRDAILRVEKDDGFITVAPDSLITYTISLYNDGTEDLTQVLVTDTLPAEVTFQSATPVPASAPPAGTSGGTLTWNGISLASGATSDILVTVQVNSAAVGPTIVNTVTVGDTAHPALTDTDDDLDIVALLNGKVISNTEPNADINPQVYIGEVVTYLLNLEVPAGATLTNLQAVDILDSGLAFVRCVSVNPGVSGNLSTTLAGGFTAACNAPTNPVVQTFPAGDPSLVNQGRQATFSLGDVTNASTTTTEVLIVTYEVVVLDIAANVNGVTGLNNSVTWTWTGGSLLAEALPLAIREPALSIAKDATPTTAPLQSIITFTLDIAHTVESTADAYDVIVTDILPPGLAYVPNSAQVVGLAPTAIDFNPATFALTFSWDVFPLGQQSTLTFQAIFVGPSPTVNTANVAWTSLPIDPALPGGPPTQLSNFNIYSTERWYDPADAAGINDYRVASSISIAAPNTLPTTGFTPGRLTALPQQPAEKAHTDLGGMWVEIPSLGLKLPITGIPLNADGWDLTWLSKQAGYLAGTTFPGQVGTTAITAHTTLADGTAGPFRNLDLLRWGDQVILHADGYRYTYEVRELRTVLPSDFSVFKQDGYTWMTLLTCKGYVPWLDTYNYRYAVRAVLLKVEPEAASTPTRESADR